MQSNASGNVLVKFYRKYKNKGQNVYNQKSSVLSLKSSALNGVAINKQTTWTGKKSE